MGIDSYGFVEHFDYMKNFIPQPFIIKSDDVLDLIKTRSGGNDGNDEYAIVTKTRTYTLTKSTISKLVSSLGVKIKLLSDVCNESDVIDLVLPAVNKLFKCFSDCFVFYATSDDALTIIDLNVNTNKGPEGSKYENGPSPWKIDINKNPSSFTCFSDFMNKYSIDNISSDIVVKADDLFSNSNTVTINLFKEITGVSLQPMLTFSSKFSNMNGFSDIHTTLYDSETGIYIPFPMNYAKTEGASFEDLWGMAVHIFEGVDVNDYIFSEINELAASKDTPLQVKNFIADVLTDSVINLNQPIKDILSEYTNITENMKPSKKHKLSNQIGVLIAYALVMRHSGCDKCGHIEIH